MCVYVCTGVCPLYIYLISKYNRAHCSMHTHIHIYTYVYTYTHTQPISLKAYVLSLRDWGFSKSVARLDYGIKQDSYDVCVCVCVCMYVCVCVCMCVCK